MFQLHYQHKYLLTYILIFDFIKIAAVQKTQDGKKYQVAWTQEVEKAKAGDVEVNLYDDSGYSAMKRVLERGDDAASVKPLVTIVVNHPVSTLKINSDGLFWIQVAVRNYNKLMFNT